MKVVLNWVVSGSMSDLLSTFGFEVSISLHVIPFIILVFPDRRDIATLGGRAPDL